MTSALSARPRRGLVALATVTVLLSGCAAMVDQRAGQREAEFEARFPPTGQIIQLGETRVHADVRGKGPDLILLHGASGNTRDFTFDLADRLAPDFRVIALDRPGLGWTDTIGADTASPIAQAELLQEAAKRLDVRRPIVLGHSYGGAVAMAWALQDPDDTRAVVLLSAATHPWPGQVGKIYPALASPIGSRTAVPLLTAFAPLSLIENAIARVFEPQSPPDGYAAYVGAELVARRESFAANAGQLAALRYWLQEMAPRYPDLHMPIEVVHGNRDTTVGLEYHARRMADDVDSARLTVLDGVGHMPHHADPQAVVDAVKRAAARSQSASVE